MPASDELILQLVGSLTLADHLGDVWDDVYHFMKLANVDASFLDDTETDREVQRELAKRGITTLYGTSLEGEESE